jgi:hypothetical protein
LLAALVAWAPVLARPTRRVLFAAAHLHQPGSRQKAMNILENWVQRANALKLTPAQIGVRLVDLDVPEEQAVATKLGMDTSTGLALGLATTDDKGMPDKLEEKAGPFDTDMTRSFRNPELGRLVDAISTLLGKAAAESGHPMPYVGLYVIDPPRMSIEEQAMYQVVKDGAVVFHVTPDSPAKKAGLREGDEVLAVDNHSTPSARTYWAAVNAKAVAASVKIKWRRAGKPATATFKVSSWP